MLRLIYIEKGNVAKRKSFKRSGDRGRLIPTCGQKSNVKLVPPKHDITVDDQHQKLPKNIATNKLYMKAKYRVCAD